MANEARLGHRSFKGVHYQQYAVGHVEHAFHLAAKVAVAWRVDNVDFVILVTDGNIFGEDGDASLTFQVVVVKKEFLLLLVLTEKIALVKKAVNESGFAVIDVGDNCYVFDFLHFIMN